MRSAVLFKFRSPFPSEAFIPTQPGTEKRTVWHNEDLKMCLRKKMPFDDDGYDGNDDEQLFGTKIRKEAQKAGVPIIASLPPTAARSLPTQAASEASCGFEVQHRS